MSFSQANLLSGDRACPIQGDDMGNVMSSYKAIITSGDGNHVMAMSLPRLCYQFCRQPRRGQHGFCSHAVHLLQTRSVIMGAAIALALSS